MTTAKTFILTGADGRPLRLDDEGRVGRSSSREDLRQGRLSRRASFDRAWRLREPPCVLR
ncbi:MAG: hypothetical protein JWM34_4020 [Ilumatobacteraceae bacterium]|nr:hypothetical protein [Ilumatobacteraceae bacterium]